MKEPLTELEKEQVKVVGGFIICFVIVLGIIFVLGVVIGKLL